MRKIAVIVAVIGVLVGFGASSFYRSESQKPPTYIFAREVTRDDVLVPKTIVELSALDLAIHRGLAEALERATPEAKAITPVVTQIIVGKFMLSMLGGEATDLLRARVRNYVYVYSVESEGMYFNVCIVFNDSIRQAKQNGWYWLGLFKTQ